MNVLLGGAVAMFVLSICLAWLVTFSRIFPIKGVKGGLVKDVDVLLKGHIDYVLMSLFCMAFYAVAVPLPVTLQWVVVIGGFTNPGIFLFMAFMEDFWKYKSIHVYTAATFILTTVGFFWVGVLYVQHILN